jgi:Fe-S-cluster-containing dehydrogenase component
MTDRLDRLPENGGDIGTELVEGKLSRRNFVMLAGLVGFAALGGMKAYGTLTNKRPILTGSKGVLLHEPSRCVGCRRCETACTEFNDNFASSALARVKVNRNLSFGPRGAGQEGWSTAAEGNFGNGKVIAETCKQCPHPVPCAEACPAGAITADAVTGARVINQSVCIGCGICTTACPWKMPVMNGEENVPRGANPNTKAQKCFLCNGSPECVHACPTGALQYVTWRDLRANTPVVQSGILPAATTTNCSTCHS